VSAAATSGLPVTFTVSGVCTNSGTHGATVTPTGATGICTVTAHQAGRNYNGADVRRRLQFKVRLFLPLITRTTLNTQHPKP
jgi:hypothetical protein